MGNNNFFHNADRTRKPFPWRWTSLLSALISWLATEALSLLSFFTLNQVTGIKNKLKIKTILFETVVHKPLLLSPSFTVRSQGQGQTFSRRYCVWM